MVGMFTQTQIFKHVAANHKGRLFKGVLIAKLNNTYCHHEMKLEKCNDVPNKKNTDSATWRHNV